MITQKEFEEIAKNHLKVRNDGSTYIDDPVLAKKYEEYINQNTIQEKKGKVSPSALPNHSCIQESDCKCPPDIGCGSPDTKCSPPVTTQDRLNAGQQLNVNNQLLSQNGKAKLIMQGDGNLVLYRTDTNQSLWASNTNGKPMICAIMQGDGNFVGYNVVIPPFSPNNALWSTNTYGHPGSYVVLQNDGNLVVYGPDNTALWASNTVHDWSDWQFPQNWVPNWGDGTPTSLSRVIHISDLHFTTAGHRLVPPDDGNWEGTFHTIIDGVLNGNLPTKPVNNPYNELANFIISNKDFWKTNLIIHTGDITDCGDIPHYKLACDFYSKLQQNNFIILNIPGNHDYYKWGVYNQGGLTEAIQQIWKDGDSAGIQARRNRYSYFIERNPYPYTQDYGNLKIILLDSQSDQIDNNTDNGYTSIGSIGKANLTWLSNELNKYQDERKNGTKVMVCLHHHPFHSAIKDPSGRLTYDSTGGLTDAVDFLSIIFQKVDCLLFGHISPDGYCQMDFQNEQDYYNIPLINCENLENGTNDNSPITVIDLSNNTKEVYPLDCLVPEGSSFYTTILASVCTTLELTVPFTGIDDNAPWTAVPTATLQVTTQNPCSLMVTFPYTLGYPDNTAMGLDIRMYVDGILVATQIGTLNRTFKANVKVASGPHTISFEVRSSRLLDCPPVNVYLAGVSGDYWNAGGQELPSLTTITVTSTPIKYYTFSLDSFEILNTRSVHTDTDVVCMGLQVNSDNPQIKSMYVGDFNNGNYGVNLHFENIEIADTDRVMVTYVIFNSGDVSQGINAAETLVQKMLAAGSNSLAKLEVIDTIGAEGDAIIGGAIGAAIGGIIPGLGSIMCGFIGAGLGWLWGMLTGGDCDGVVAAYANAFTGADINRRAGATDFSQETIPFPGLESPSVCRTSSYNVTWSFGDPGNYPPPHINSLCGCPPKNPHCQIP